jgi:hypothetical protein
VTMDSSTSLSWSSRCSPTSRLKLTGGFIIGTFDLVPMNFSYMTAGPILGLMFNSVILYFRSQYLSRKPVSMLPLMK